MKKIISLYFLALISAGSIAQKKDHSASVRDAANSIEQKVIGWRHDFHEHPELGNREFRTAEIIAKHLQSLGMEVKTKVGVTGVVGILKGGQPGPVVALRADMDALPVEEKNNLSFASKVKTDYNGKNVGYACVWARCSCCHPDGCG